MERDTNLDCYRGIAILWVLFIHSIYWMGLFTSPTVVIAKSYLLFEMPLLFCITGMSNSLSNNNDNLLKYFSKRIKRIIVPYWVYAFICVFITQITITYLHAQGKISYIGWFTFGFMGNLWTNVPYLISHLWFVPVYLLIIFFIPILKYFYNLLIYNKKLIPLLILAIFVMILDNYKISNGLLHYYVKSICVYSFWIYLGLFYSDLKNKQLNKYLIIAISILSYLAVGISIKIGYNPNMQLNKFPPNMIFLVLNIGNLSLIILLKDFIIKLLNIFHVKDIVIKIGQYSYTVYLYQPFGFLLGAIILGLLKINLVDYDIIGSLYYWAINIFAALIFIKMFGWIEKPKVNIKNFTQSENLTH